ncbi:MAG: hypothetical protein AB7U83_21795, partial [Vicinamibacterales bacterium]
VVGEAPENLAAIRGMAEIIQREGDVPSALEYFPRALTLARHDPELEEIVEQLSRQVGAEAGPANGLSFEEAHQELLSAAERVPLVTPTEPPTPTEAAPAGGPTAPFDFDTLVAALGTPAAPPMVEAVVSGATPPVFELPEPPPAADGDPFAALEAELRAQGDLVAEHIEAPAEPLADAEPLVDAAAPAAEPPVSAPTADADDEPWLTTRLAASETGADVTDTARPADDPPVSWDLGPIEVPAEPAAAAEPTAPLAFAPPEEARSPESPAAAPPPAIDVFVAAWSVEAAPPVSALDEQEVPAMPGDQSTAESAPALEGDSPLAEVETALQGLAAELPLGELSTTAAAAGLEAFPAHEAQFEPLAAEPASADDPNLAPAAAEALPVAEPPAPAADAPDAADESGEPDDVLGDLEDWLTTLQDRSTGQ